MFFEQTQCDLSMMRHVTALFALILILGMTVPAAGQTADTGSLEGQVLSEEDNAPLPGATVLLPDLDRGTTTDESGAFTFTDVPAGPQSLEVRFVGFKTYRTDVEMPREAPVVIRLAEEEVTFDDVIVTGSPVGNTLYQSAQAFNVEALQERSASSFGELLDGEPGIAMRSFGPAPARPVIRGFDGDRVLILENGLRMGDISSTAPDHNITLDPMAAERVEIIRGPSSLLHGSSAIGGVVNLLTSDIPRNWTPGTSGTITMEGASMNNALSGLTRVQHADDTWATTARLSYRDADDVRTPNGLLPGTAISNLEGQAGFAYEGAALSSGLSFSAIDHTFGLPEGIDDSDESAEIRMDQQRIQGEATWQLNQFVKDATLQFQGARLFQQEVESEIEPDGTIDEDVELEYLRYSGNATLTLRHRPVGILDEGALGADVYLGTTDLGGDDAFSPGISQETVALFTFQEVPLTQTTRLQFGVRAETQSARTRPNDDFPDIDERVQSRALSGSIGLNVRPTSNVEIGAQVARAHRFPLVEERFADGVHFGASLYEEGDPTLGTEIGLGTDLFMRWSNDRIRLNLAGFYTRIDDFIAFGPTGETFEDTQGRVWDVFRYRAADARLVGGEAQVHTRLTEALSLEGHLDYVRGSRIDSGNPLPTMPPLRGTLRARYDTGRWWVGSRLRMVDTQDRVAPDELSTDGYTLVDAQAGLRLDANGLHRITLRVDNVTDALYRDHLSRIDRSEFGFPMPGRNMSVSYRYAF